ncbi:MAG: hypothetical protein F6K00_30030 [Leptolyngbya sp. SIOISBB]|nr:hypothetical protein [Leptolyngbya sp. SIOISBB]
MNRKLIPALVAGTVFVTQPAADAAGLFEFTSLLNQAFQNLSAILNEEIAEQYDPEVARLIQVTVNDAVGVLGLPAPYDTAQNLEAAFSELPQTDITLPVPVSEVQAIQRNVNRALVRQQSNSLLGQDGQEAALQRTEDIGTLVQQTQQHADTALSAISTQAVIKEMTQQQARSAELLGALHTETLQSRQDTATQSLALADISESLDQQLTGRALERRGEAITSLRQAAAARLF